MGTRSDITDGLAVVALLLAGAAAATGLLVSGLYRDTAEMVREARAADLVTLVVAVPALGLGLWRARSGSARARLIAIGALGYLSYSYAIFAFSVVINPLTPVHIAILGLAVGRSCSPSSGSTSRRSIAQVGSACHAARPAASSSWWSSCSPCLWLGQIAGAISERQTASIHQ